MNWLFHFSQPVLAYLIFIGEQWKRKRGRERQEVLWPDTHAKIATVKKHTKIALSESAKVDQISSLAFARFWYRNFHTVGECVDFWEKNACFNLVRARMERLISALRWKLKDSRLRRFLNLPQIFREWFVLFATQVWLSREPVQQKILYLMLNDYSQTERLWPVYAHF